MPRQWDDAARNYVDASCRLLHAELAEILGLLGATVFDSVSLEFGIEEGDWITDGVLNKAARDELAGAFGSIASDAASWNGFGSGCGEEVEPGGVVVCGSMPDMVLDELGRRLQEYLCLEDALWVALSRLCEEENIFGASYCDRIEIRQGDSPGEFLARCGRKWLSAALEKMELEGVAGSGSEGRSKGI